MSHAEDDDHTRFLRLEGARNADGEEAVVSVAALQHQVGNDHDCI